MDFGQDCAECFAGLACQPRIVIINLLKKKGKMSVSEIAEHFETKQPTVSHHLKYLKKVGILRSERMGRKIYYFIDPKCGKDLCELF